MGNNSNQTLVFVVLFMFLASLAVNGYFIFQNYKLQQKIFDLVSQSQTDKPNTPMVTQTENQDTPMPINTATNAPSPTTNPQANWITYTDQEYGFKFSYPQDYEALTDEDNLYGWPNAVALLYKGVQSYDIPIEVWDSKAEYQEKYSAGAIELQAKQLGDKFVTFANNNMNEDFDEIVNTFQQL